MRIPEDESTHIHKCAMHTRYERIAEILALYKSSDMLKILDNLGIIRNICICIRQFYGNGNTTFKEGILSFVVILLWKFYLYHPFCQNMIIKNIIIIIIIMVASYIAHVRHVVMLPALVKPCSPCSSSVNNCYIRIYLDAIINTLMEKVYEELCCNWQAIICFYNHSLSIPFL